MTTDNIELRRLRKEMKNLEERFTSLLPTPQDIPQMQHIEIYGQVEQLNGIVGGDHLRFIDFSKLDIDYRIELARQEQKHHIIPELERQRNRAGILLIDVMGHHLTDSVLASNIDYLIQLGIRRDFTEYGNVTTRTFEETNDLMYHTTEFGRKAMITYFEIGEDGTVKMINVGNPHPRIFSKKYQGMISDEVENHEVLGLRPSQTNPDARKIKSLLGFKSPYTVSELKLRGRGDSAIIATGGLIEHTACPKKDIKSHIEDHFYGHIRLEEVVKKFQNYSAKVISEMIMEDVYRFGQPDDDVSFVVIKKR